MSGQIMLGDKVLSTISGSYLEQISFDDVKYWDIRENFGVTIIEPEIKLLSDSTLREDLNLLDQEKMEEAQQAKEKIENLQRYDRKLREKHGGGKH